MSDRLIDLLEFIAGAAVAVGFIFLSAFVLVGDL